MLGPFVLAAPENTAGEMPAWLAMASSGGQPYLCRLQALPMPLSTPPGTARRIQRATRGLRRLPRRNLAAGMGLALVDQRLMLVERPTAGVSLADLLPGAFPADSACLIVQQLARVLTGLRKRGLDVLVTGRLAPERVRIGWNGEVQLLGAGLAIARREGLLAPSLPDAARRPRPIVTGPGRPRAGRAAVGTAVRPELRGHHRQCQRRSERPAAIRSAPGPAAPAVRGDCPGAGAPTRSAPRLGEAAGPGPG